MPGHIHGHQLAHGDIPRLGWSTGLTVCRTCDNRSGQQPAHLRPVTALEHRAEWV
ncbi:hypothetical protein AB0E83_18835 [Streptomyces sp. NPDC035033]|uniref:hypothetical protein n=1 Tax=Streptomyces sp. NPDC035033 TaxID=3155368 RepID=UPI0033E611C5